MIILSQFWGQQSLLWTPEPAKTFGFIRLSNDFLRENIDRLIGTEANDNFDKGKSVRLWSYAHSFARKIWSTAQLTSKLPYHGYATRLR